MASRFFNKLGSNTTRFFNKAGSQTERLFNKVGEQVVQQAKDSQRQARRVGNDLESMGDKVESYKNMPGVAGSGAKLVGSLLQGAGATAQLVGSRSGKEAGRNAIDLLREGQDIALSGGKVAGAVGSAYSTGNPLPLFI
jgi:hypothetical protein